MKTTIFIDESGTLPDTADRYIIVAAIATFHPALLTHILAKFRKNTPQKGSRKRERQVPEFKFHYVGEQTRKRVLREIAKQNPGIYILAIDKMGRKIADTPGNYFKLLKCLIGLIIEYEEVSQIKLDRHFRPGSKLQDLDAKLTENFTDIEILQTDSLLDSRIDLTDFVAGAMLRKYNSDDNQFSNIFTDQVKAELMIKWNELK